MARRRKRHNPKAKKHRRHATKLRAGGGGRILEGKATDVLKVLAMMEKFLRAEERGMGKAKKSRGRKKSRNYFFAKSPKTKKAKKQLERQISALLRHLRVTKSGRKYKRR
jgi:uncharacterized membrane protein YgaE (UPF0421/DUF939 family)